MSEYILKNPFQSSGEFALQMELLTAERDKAVAFYEK